MSKRVLVLQSDSKSAQVLSAYFTQRGDQVCQANHAIEAGTLLEKERPDLALIDLHWPDNDWLVLLARIRQEYPETRVIITNKTPDVRLELMAREQGANVFLRTPFTATWIERALAKLEPGRQASPPPAALKDQLPGVRVPMRIKITLPYVFLALVFVLASAFLVGRYILETIQERFTNQLVDAGRLSADWMVQEESRILETVRLIAHTEGIPEAISLQNSNRLREIILPLAINYREEAIEILDLKGTSLLSLHHSPGGNIEEYLATQGDTSLSGLIFVQKVLQKQADSQGNKFAGVMDASWGNFFYIAGPILDRDGRLVGVVLVGKSLDTLVREIQRDILAHLTLYQLDGGLAASTLFLKQGIYPLPPDLTQAVLQRQNESSSLRELQVASVTFSEILAPWEARSGEDLGVIGVSLSQNFLVRPKQITGVQAFLIVTLTFLGMIVLGMMMAKQITQPLSQMVKAFAEVAGGNFRVKVTPTGNDEVMVLGHAFNYMVSGLQEGSIYRDLLGRTVSPEVREALRLSFASGNLRLEGHNTVATVLISDIRNFTALSEKQEPTIVLAWLNEYFGELVPVITRYGGVVDKFQGDAMLAFFGILPTPQPPEKSAYQACLAAAEMLDVVESINARRAVRGEPALITGIAINTGGLTAGGLGTTDRLNFTIIGDTVNATQRMEGLTRNFGESGVVIGEKTLTALHDRRAEFDFEPLGEHAVKGKSEALWLYRLRPIQSRRYNGNGQQDNKTEAESAGLGHAAGEDDRV